jgi:hypothetical protein
MKEITLCHNPFKAETRLNLDGNAVHLACLGSGEGCHIEEWKADFFQQLQKKINIGPGSACAVIFYGLEEDFKILETEWQSYSRANEKIKIFFERGISPLATLAQKQKERDALFETVLGDSSCETFNNSELKTKIAETKSMSFPEYISEAEKLEKQIKIFDEVIASFKPRIAIDIQITQKKVERERLITAIEENKKLEASKNNSSLEDELQKAKDEYAELNSIYNECLAEALDKIKNEKATIKKLMDSISGSVSARKSLTRILSNTLQAQISKYRNQFGGTESVGSIKNNISIYFSPSVDVIAMPGKSAKSIFDGIFDDAEKAAIKYSEEIRDSFGGNINEKVQTLQDSVLRERNRRQKEIELSMIANDETLANLDMEIAALEQQLAWIDDFTVKLNTILEIQDGKEANR